VDLIGDDRATILGALLWMADKLKSDQGERARALWAAMGKQAFEADPATHVPHRSLVRDNGTLACSATMEASSGHLEETGGSACSEIPEKVCLLPANWAGLPSPHQGGHAAAADSRRRP
jgi:hypothetical protein